MTVESVLDDIISIMKDRLNELGVEYHIVSYDDRDNLIMVSLNKNMPRDIIYKLIEKPIISNITFSLYSSYNTHWFFTCSELIEKIKQYIRSENLKELI